jgi:hypothetical protein
VVTQNLWALTDRFLNVMDLNSAVWHHDMSHYSPNRRPNNPNQNDWKDFEKIKTWMVPGGDAIEGFRWRFRFIKNWLDKLSTAYDERGRSLLDRSLIFANTEYAVGHHTHFARTAWTFGGAGGKMQTGWHINGGAAPFQKIHTTVMHALGLSANDIEIEGTPGFGDYAQSSDPHQDITMRHFYPSSMYDELVIRDHSRFGFFTSAAEKRRAFPIV